uniref:Uncharacterized protein n=1 Tax=Ditylenchus dipsaci TaxID=166011 RepID=A0A915EF06_9BILA
MRHSSSTRSRKEQKLLKNLSAFEKWLDLVEQDVQDVMDSPRLDHSLASSSAFSERTEEWAEDLDSDLASIQSEVTRAQALHFSRASSLEKANSVAQLFVEASTSLAKGELSLNAIEQEINSVIESMNRIKSHYSTSSLKPLFEAEEDAKAFKSYVKQLDFLKEELKKLEGLASQDKQEKRLHKLVKLLKKEKNVAKQLINNLGVLETEVYSSTSAGRVPDTKDCLSNVELEIELLKKQCRASRKYVEISVDGSRSASPTRKFKIILKITNTVTTLIQVIEDELKRQQLAKKKAKKSASEAELTLLHKKLSKLNDSTKEMSARASAQSSKHQSSEPPVGYEEVDTSRSSRHAEPRSPRLPTETVTMNLHVMRTSEGTLDSTEDVLKCEATMVEAPMVVDDDQLRKAGLELVQESMQRKLETAQSSKKFVDIHPAEKYVDENITHLAQEFTSGQFMKESATKPATVSNSSQEALARLQTTIEVEENVLKDPHASIEEIRNAIVHCQQSISEAENLLASPLPTQLGDEIRQKVARLGVVVERLTQEHQQATKICNNLKEGQQLLSQLNTLLINICGSPLTSDSAISQFKDIQANQELVDSLTEKKKELQGIAVELPIVTQMNEALKNMRQSRMTSPKN